MQIGGWLGCIGDQNSGRCGFESLRRLFGTRLLVHGLSYQPVASTSTHLSSINLGRCVDRPVISSVYSMYDFIWPYTVCMTQNIFQDHYTKTILGDSRRYTFFLINIFGTCPIIPIPFPPAGRARDASDHAKIAVDLVPKHSKAVPELGPGVVEPKSDVFFASVVVP